MTDPLTHSPLNDPRVHGVLDRLHRAAAREKPALALSFVTQLPGLLLGRGVRFDPARSGALDDKLIPIGPAQGRLLYMLVRAMRAELVVELGTSYGVSTLYLAAAMRDQGRGRVITSEIIPEKAARARAHFEEAGLSEWVELREGDATETLAAMPGPIDLALLDGFPTIALDVLRTLEPHLREGATVLADDLHLFRHDLGPLVEHLEDPANGYRTLELPIDDGFLFAIRERAAG